MTDTSALAVAIARCEREFSQYQWCISRDGLAALGADFKTLGSAHRPGNPAAALDAAIDDTHRRIAESTIAAQHDAAMRKEYGS